MITKALAAVGLAAGAMTAVVSPAAQAAEAPAPAKAAAGTYQGCPYGAVCIYPRDAGWNNGYPSNIYYDYGVHKLSNQVGFHVVFNNQYGGAKADLCKTYRGTNCVQRFPERTTTNYDLTPINSIRLLG